jgi:hypothetical protein
LEVSHQVGHVVGVEVADLGVEEHGEIVLELLPLLLEDTADEIGEFDVELGELLYHHLSDYVEGLAFQNTVDGVVECKSWTLQFLEQGVKQ